MTLHKYRVREGFTYGAFAQHKAGAILELDDSVAQHAMDKLELAEVTQNVVPSEPTPKFPPPPVVTSQPDEESDAPKTAKHRKSGGD